MTFPRLTAVLLLVLAGPSLRAGEPLVFVGGVAGAAALAEATNSTAFRQAGGGLYLHNNGWAAVTPEQRTATLQVFGPAPVGIELGFAPGPHARSWANRVKSGYLDAGIRPHFIAANAFASNNKPTAEQWAGYVRALRDAGLPDSTLVLPTFEFANFRENIPLIATQTVSRTPVFQGIIREAGGIVLDTPSGYVFSREENYRAWVLDAIRWTRSAGGRTVVILSPHIFGPKFDADTRRYLAWLRENDALPDWYVVENYDPSPPAGYPNVVGHEAQENTTLGCGLMVLRWLRPAAPSR